jgi:phosphoribosylformylglycinamidine synthase
MSTFNVRVIVRLQPEVVDPVGSTIESGLKNMGFSTVSGTRVGKVVEFTVEAIDAEEAWDYTKKMSDQLLVNPTIENYHIDLVDLSGKEST